MAECRAGSMPGETYFSPGIAEQHAASTMKSASSLIRYARLSGRASTLIISHVMISVRGIGKEPILQRDMLAQVSLPELCRNAAVSMTSAAKATRRDRNFRALHLQGLDCSMPDPHHLRSPHAAGSLVVSPRWDKDIRAYYRAMAAEPLPDAMRSLMTALASSQRSIPLPQSRT